MIQADPTGAVGTVVVNASDVDIQGIELELTALVTRDSMIGAERVPEPGGQA